MRFIQQEPNLAVRNFDSIASSSSESCDQRHSKLLPNTVRCIICGPSNCGKTNVLLSLLTHDAGLKFENIYLYSKTLFQPKYEFLKDCVARVKGMGFFPYADNTAIVKPQNAKRNSVFVFDDISCDKQDCMREYFSMGRHSSVDCFYLCQTYARIPKHLIRDNSNMLVIFKQDEMNLHHIYRDHVNTDMTFQNFKDFCTDCWRNNKYSFAVINKDCELNDGRYRKGFDTYLQ